MFNDSWPNTDHWDHDRNSNTCGKSLATGNCTHGKPEKPL